MSYYVLQSNSRSGSSGNGMNTASLGGMGVNGFFSPSAASSIGASMGNRYGPLGSAKARYEALGWEEVTPPGVDKEQRQRERAMERERQFQLQQQHSFLLQQQRVVVNGGGSPKSGKSGRSDRQNTLTPDKSVNGASKTTVANSSAAQLCNGSFASTSTAAPSANGHHSNVSGKPYSLLGALLAQQGISTGVDADVPVSASAPVAKVPTVSEALGKAPTVERALTFAEAEAPPAATTAVDTSAVSSGALDNDTLHVLSTPPRVNSCSQREFEALRAGAVSDATRGRKDTVVYCPPSAAASIATPPVASADVTPSKRPPPGYSPTQRGTRHRNGPTIRTHNNTTNHSSATGSPSVSSSSLGTSPALGTPHARGTTAAAHANAYHSTPNLTQLLISQCHQQAMLQRQHQQWHPTSHNHQSVPGQLFHDATSPSMIPYHQSCNHQLHFGHQVSSGQHRPHTATSVGSFGGRSHNGSHPNLLPTSPDVDYSPQAHYHNHYAHHHYNQQRQGSGTYGHQHHPKSSHGASSSPLYGAGVNAYQSINCISNQSTQHNGSLQTMAAATPKRYRMRGSGLDSSTSLHHQQPHSNSYPSSGAPSYVTSRNGSKLDTPSKAAAGSNGSTGTFVNFGGETPASAMGGGGEGASIRSTTPSSTTPLQPSTGSLLLKFNLTRKEKAATTSLVTNQPIVPAGSSSSVRSNNGGVNGCAENGGSIPSTPSASGTRSVSIVNSATPTPLTTPVAAMNLAFSDAGVACGLTVSALPNSASPRNTTSIMYNGPHHDPEQALNQSTPPTPSLHLPAAISAHRPTFTTTYTRKNHSNLSNGSGVGIIMPHYLTPSAPMGSANGPALAIQSSQQAPHPKPHEKERMGGIMGALRNKKANTGTTNQHQKASQQQQPQKAPPPSTSPPRDPRNVWDAVFEME